MSGQKAVTTSEFIPPPIDGLNLVSPPTLVKPSEARDLTNYYIYDWGIRQRGPMRAIALTHGGYPINMYSYSSATERGTLISASNSYIYRYNPSNDALTELSSTTQFCNAFSYNQIVFLPRLGTNDVATYDPATSTYAATSFACSVTLLGGCVYKDRCYFWGEGTEVDYAVDAGAVTGAVETVDFGRVFQEGTRILFCANWSYNQGLQNDELFVIVTEAGEVLVYSGDWPAAANWTLVTRVRIPAPLKYPDVNATAVSSPVHTGQDLLIVTSRGVVSLAQVIAGRQDLGESYYLISRNLGPILSGAQADRSILVPFAYFASENFVYVLNYERGAWSKLDGATDILHHISCFSCGQQPPSLSTSTPVQSYTLIGVNSGGFMRVDESALVSDSDARYNWSTPWFDFGESVQKQSKMVRVLGRDMAEKFVFNNCATATELTDATQADSSYRRTDISDDSYLVQELAPPGVGKWISYIFTVDNAIWPQGGEQCNEIAGFDAFYEKGGLY